MVVTLYILVMIPTTLLRGWALFVLWGWFMVPLGVPGVGIAHALGLSVLASLFMLHLQHEKTDGKDEIERAVRRIVTSLLASLFAVTFGWLVHQFM